MAKIVLYYSLVEDSDVNPYSGEPQYFTLQGDVTGYVVEGEKLLSFKNFTTASIVEFKKQEEYEIGFTLINHDDVVYPIVTTINNTIITPYKTLDSLLLKGTRGQDSITAIPAGLYSTLDFEKYKINLYSK